MVQGGGRIVTDRRSPPSVCQKSKIHFIEDIARTERFVPKAGPGRGERGTAHKEQPWRRARVFPGGWRGGYTPFSRRRASGLVPASRRPRDHSRRVAVTWAWPWRRRRRRRRPRRPRPGPAAPLTPPLPREGMRGVRGRRGLTAALARRRTALRRRTTWGAPATFAGTSLRSRGTPGRGSSTRGAASFG